MPQNSRAIQQAEMTSLFLNKSNDLEIEIATYVLGIILIKQSNSRATQQAEVASLLSGQA
jgi:hypothetical protein